MENMTTLRTSSNGECIIANADGTKAHRWVCGDPIRSRNVVPATCRKCGIHKEFDATGGIDHETMAERRIEGMVG